MKRYVALVCAVLLTAAPPAFGSTHTQMLERTHQWRPGSHHRVCAHIPRQAHCDAVFNVSPRTGAIVSSSSPPAGAYGPPDFHRLYNLPWKTSSSHRHTIALVDAFRQPFIRADLAVFDKFYGLPPAPLTIVNEFGHRRPLPAFPPKPLLSWLGETALDVETAHGICPDCHLILVSTRSQTPRDLGQGVKTARRLGADIISNSYGFTYSGGQRVSHTVFPDYIQPGAAVLASAGDSQNDVAFPAAMRTVVAVGGTTLFSTSSGNYGGEIVWGDASGNPNAPNGGTGSGCATPFGFPAASWQTSLAVWPAVGCGPGRGIGDVSADADPRTGAAVVDPLFGGWTSIGGTSLASPLIAGVYGLAGVHYKFPAKGLYKHLGSSGLNDVTQGANGHVGDGICTAFRQCNAAVGYDLPSGVGTPNGLRAFK